MSPVSKHSSTSRRNSAMASSRSPTLALAFAGFDVDERVPCPNAHALGEFSRPRQHPCPLHCRGPRAAEQNAAAQNVSGRECEVVAELLGQP